MPERFDIESAPLRTRNNSKVVEDTDMLDAHIEELAQFRLGSLAPRAGRKSGYDDDEDEFEDEDFDEEDEDDFDEDEDDEEDDEDEDDYDDEEDEDEDDDDDEDDEDDEDDDEDDYPRRQHRVGDDEEDEEWEDDWEDEDEDEDEEDEDDDDEEDDDDDDWNEEDEQYSADYENEPTLLEQTYARAASRFTRQQQPQAVQTPPPVPVERIEPGFGDDDSSALMAWPDDTPSGSVDDMFNAVDDEPLVATAEDVFDEISDDVLLNDAFSTDYLDEDPVGEFQATLPEEPLSKTLSREPFSKIMPREPLSKAAPREPERTVAEEGMDDEDMDEEVEAAEPAPNKTKPKSRLFFFGKPQANDARQADPLEQENAPQPKPEPVAPSVDPGPREVLIINVMAYPGYSFRGGDLWTVLRQQGMQLGAMSIFHRHEHANGAGRVLFSMANMVKPGIFDISDMDDFSTPGVSFFLQLPCKYNNMAAFELMLDTAQALRDQLDGELKDEQRSVFTRQTAEHMRQRIRDFELAQLAARR
jgi:cell division protein ZipA